MRTRITVVTATVGLSAVAVLTLACSAGGTSPTAAPATADAAAAAAASTDGSVGAGGSIGPPGTQAVGDGQWPTFGHDHANSRHDPTETELDPTTVGSLHEAWRMDGLTGQTSTPAVVDGVVYFGDWTGKLHAVRAADGQPVWERQFSTDQINDSPLVTADTVYVADGNANFHALDRATGADEFTVHLDDHPNARIYSSPVLVDGMVVLGVASVELVVAKTDYTFRGSVVALDAKTGQERWRVYTTKNDATAGAGASVWSSPAVDEGRHLLYIGVGQTYEQPASPMADSMLAIHYDTGQVAWDHQFTHGDVFNVPTANGADGPDADVGASPNLFQADGRDLVGVGDKAGTYWTLDRDTGDEVWHQTLTNGSRLGGIMVTAATDDSTIYVSSNVGAGDHKTPGTSAVTFALAMTDGTVRWQHPVDSTVYGDLTVADGVVYHGTTAGQILALDAKTGDTKWSTMPGGDIGGGFSVSDGTLYAGYGFWLFQRDPNPDGGMVAYRVG